MTSRQARDRTRAPERHRRLAPIGAVVGAYVVAGTFWIFAGGRLAEAITEGTSIPRWMVAVGNGLLFVVTALVLQASLRRRADRLDVATARTNVAARRLATSEDRNLLQAIALAGTANAVIITGRDGTIEWVNAAFETMSGYPSSVAVGASPQLVRSGLQDDTFYRDLWGTILAGGVWRGQVVNRRRDGELYTVSQTITPVIGEGGEIRNFVAIHEDISERVRTAHELEASRLRLQSLFDHALDAIVLADDQGRYIEVNPAICELTGYARDELLGMGPADLAAPDQQPADVVKQFDDFVHAGTESGTFALRHKDGHVVETEYRAVSNIQPGVHLSVLRDVTARNSSIRALSLAESQFRELAENAPDIVTKLRIDHDGRKQVDYVNPAATTILGHPLEDLYTDPDLLHTLCDERSGDLDDAPQLPLTPAEPTRLATVQVRRADGRPVWLEVHSTSTVTATPAATIQLVARDVTARSDTMRALEQAVRDQREAAERLRTIDAMKDTFLQIVSHELRTPLTAIMGFAQVLNDARHGLSPEDTREFHGHILSSAQRLERLLDDLLDVDRFARGRIEPKRRPSDLTGLIERMVQEVDLGDHPVELDLERLTMRLDGPWVERIVANLLRNIVNHTPADAGVRIRTRATAEGVQLTVDDDGPGIPEADRGRVLDPFQQGTVAAASAQPGTGIGLSVVNVFAQLHGGEVLITDSPTGGTRVTVTLAHPQTEGPIAPTDRSAPGRSSAAALDLRDLHAPH